LPAPAAISRAPVPNRPNASILQEDDVNNPLANDALAGNLRKAQTFLARFKSTPVRHRIAGETVIGAEMFKNYDPTDNSVLCTVASGGAVEIDRAARAAEEGFKVWRTVPGEKRRALLHKIADYIEARAEEIALVESVDSGQPIRYMAKAALRGAENFRFYADKAPEAGDGLSLRISTTPSGSRSGRSASSRHGTRPSCCRPGRLHRPSRQAAP
jgi:5-carboxymethyl-2-hydroxymuconic-semialdehyde dehydrogenase